MYVCPFKDKETDMPKCNNRFSLKALAAAVSATVALGVVALPTLSHADETACSPFTPSSRDRKTSSMSGRWASKASATVQTNS